MENVLISVVPEPDPDLLKELGMAPDESLMGLYQGVSLAERSVTDPPLYPDTIFIFQRGVEEACRSLEEMEREIEVTVVHEIAHFLGMSEERLAELGYG
ncbi:MAG: metallopeptidase family protein, partial [Desulfobacteraceae bacterium]